MTEQTLKFPLLKRTLELELPALGLELLAYNELGTDPRTDDTYIYMSVQIDVSTPAGFMARGTLVEALAEEIPALQIMKAQAIIDELARATLSELAHGHRAERKENDK